jgi:hypothetical protein
LLGALKYNALNKRVNMDAKKALTRALLGIAFLSKVLDVKKR